jgi:hypothetical protein
MGRLYDAFIEVGPRFTGMGDIKKQGDQAGKEYGKALADAATKAAKAHVGKLGESLAKARSAEADAAGKVRVAETQLGEARKKYGAASSQAVAAEERLASAQRKSTASADTAKMAAQSLEKAREDLSKTADSAGASAGGRFSHAFKGSVSKLGGEKEGKAFASRFGVGMNGAIGGIVSRSAGIFVAGFAAIKSAQVFTSFINDARESAKVGRVSAQVVKSTGGVAKVSAKQMGDLAGAISNKTGADDEAIQSGENLLATFTNVRNETGKGNKIFDRATQAAVDMASAMNNGVVDANGLKAANIQLGKALNDPIKGVTALSKVGVSFTADQKKQIKTLVESGKTLEAQKIILDEVGKEFGGAAAAATDPLTKLHTIVGNVSETIGGVFLPYVDKAATWLGNNLPGAVATAGKFFDQKLLPPLKAIATFIKDEIIPGVSSVVTTFTGLGEKLANAIGPVDLSGIAKEIYSDTKGWAGSIITGLKAGLDTGDWKSLGKSLGDSVIKGIQNIASRSGELLDAIGGLVDKVDWAGIGTRISGAVSGLFESIDWKGLGKTLGDGVVTVVEKTSDLGAKLGTAFKTLVGKIDWRKIGNDSTNAIIGFVEGVNWGQVAKALGIAVLKGVKIDVEVYNAVLNGGADLITGMFQVISKKIEEGRLWLVAKTKEVGSDLISGLWGGIKSAMKGAGNFLKSTIVDPIITSIRSLFGVHSPSTVFARIGADLIAGLRAGIIAGARGIGAWLGRVVVAPVVAVFTRAGSWLVQQGRNLVAGFKSGVGEIARGIGRWMYDHIISPSVAPFGKAGTWLYQKGRNVISGFKNGMVSVWHDVTEWVGGIATWIKDHKGPVSLDARLLIPAGQAIMSGFLKGLKSGAGPAWSFVKNVGGKTVSALQASIGGPFSGPGGPDPKNLSQMQALVRTVAAQRGWGSGAEWSALYNLIQGESGFNPNAQNPTSSAYGLFQFLNSTWGAVGASKTSDPWAQTAAGLKYIAMSYGDPINAYSQWRSRSPHWYKKGTPWVPDDQLAFLHKGEAVLPRAVNEARIAASSNSSGLVELGPKSIAALAQALAGLTLNIDGRSLDTVVSGMALGKGY